MTAALKHGARNVLRKDQVLEIFKRKVVGRVYGTSLHSQPDAKKVGKEFGVTPKAVRDIWTGRTWYRETLHLDPARPDAPERLSKRVGRPKGSKDKKPRRPRESASTGSIQNFGSPISQPQFSTEPTIQSIKSRIIVKESLRDVSTTEMQDGSDQSITASRSVRDTSSFSGPDACALENSKSYACVEFLDPFHDDWIFWKSKNEVETVFIHAESPVSRQ